MNKKTAYTMGIIILISLGLLIYFADSTENILNKQHQRKPIGDIHIGVVESSEISGNFQNGVRLAVAKINGKGGVKNRKIIPLIRDDKGDVQRGMAIAEEFSADPSLLAVVGHNIYDATMASSVIYESKGIVFITTRGSEPELTVGEYVFRNIPSKSHIVKETVYHMRNHGYTSIIVFFQNNCKQWAIRFKDEFNNYNIVNFVNFSFLDNKFTTLFQEMKKKYRFDAIYIAGKIPAAAYLIKNLREMEITAPIFSGLELNSPQLKLIAGKASHFVNVPDFYDEQSDLNRMRDFIKAFKAKYGFIPDRMAASGYDAIMLLAHAMTKSASMVPMEIKENLKNLNWESVFGKYYIDFRGNASGIPIFFKTMQENGFQWSKQRSHFKEYSLYDYDTAGILRIPIKNCDTTFDPGLITEQSDIEICEQLFLGLTDFDPKTYKAVPELASGWTVSSDGTVYTFTLLNKNMWTDKEPLTANDVEWAIRRNISLKNSYNKHIFNIIKNADPIIKGTIKDLNELGVKAIDKYTVVFQLEHPSTSFPLLAGLHMFRPLPQHIIEKYGDEWTDLKNIVSNGPYRICKTSQNGIVLSKKRDYYDTDKVSIPEIHYLKISSSELGLQMYMNNELDIMGGPFLPIPIKDVVRIQSDPILKKEYNPDPLSLCSSSFLFRTLHYPVNDSKVRKAIAAAIPRNYILKAFNLKEKSTTTFVPSPAFGAVELEEGIGISFDPLQAKEWLAEAGFPNGNGFPVINFLYNDSSNYIKIAKAVKISLKHYLNIELRLFPLIRGEDVSLYDATTQFLERQKKTPHLFGFTWCSDFPDSNYILSVIVNLLKPIMEWNNEEFDKLIKKAKQAKEQDKKNKMYKRAEQILCEEQAALIPIYFKMNPYLIKQRLKGCDYMSFGGQQIRHWYLEEK
jgi:ABC-type oligopeptide transport system substrate-binding subunit/ABC-type branched-subunit amino acid transport system substrate-binding protein